MQRTPHNPTTPCPICPHGCAPAEGALGACKARISRDGSVQPLHPGAYSALALDPIEKKPLYDFHPGTSILSIGCFGCNLHCWFCQNSAISQNPPSSDAPRITPEALVQQALALLPKGNIGIAYTYNEPGVAFEFIQETALLAREKGLYNVMITNGYLNEAPWRALLQTMDAFNIDLKCFTEEGYRRLNGDLSTVRRNIALAAGCAHVEVTTLIVPGFSDSEEDMARQAQWLASISPSIPLHLTRYFPRYRASELPTPLETLERLAQIARGHLERVRLGNC